MTKKFCSTVAVQSKQQQNNIILHQISKFQNPENKKIFTAVVTANRRTVSDTEFANPLPLSSAFVGDDVPVPAGDVVAGADDAAVAFVNMAASGEFGARCSSSIPKKTKVIKLHI